MLVGGVVGESVTLRQLASSGANPRTAGSSMNPSWSPGDYGDLADLEVGDVPAPSPPAHTLVRIAAPPKYGRDFVPGVAQLADEPISGEGTRSREEYSHCE